MRVNVDDCPAGRAMALPVRGKTIVKQLMLELLWKLTPDFIGDIIWHLTNRWWVKYVTDTRNYFVLTPFPSSRSVLNENFQGVVKGHYENYLSEALERGAIPMENVRRWEHDGDYIEYLDPKTCLMQNKPKSECELV